MTSQHQLQETNREVLVNSLSVTDNTPHVNTMQSHTTIIDPNNITTTSNVLVDSLAYVAMKTTGDMNTQHTTVLDNNNVLFDSHVSVEHRTHNVPNQCMSYLKKKRKWI